MAAPYRTAIEAIRAALNIDAKSLYAVQSWQKLIDSGYLDWGSHGDLTKVEAYQQAVLTYLFLHSRMPADQWAILIVQHSLKSKGGNAERERLRWAAWAVAGLCGTGDTQLDRWYTLKWGGYYKGPEGIWDVWQGERDVSVRTIRRRCETQTAPALRELLKRAEATADRLLADGGLIQRSVAA